MRNAPIYAYGMNCIMRDLSEIILWLWAFILIPIAIGHLIFVLRYSREIPFSWWIVNPIATHLWALKAKATHPFIHSVAMADLAMALLGLCMLLAVIVALGIS